MTTVTNPNGNLPGIDLYDDAGNQLVKARAKNISTDSDTGVVSGDLGVDVEVSISGSFTNDGTFAKETGGNLATLAGIVSSSKAAVKAGSGDFADGALATTGAKGDAAASDSTSSWSVIALLKGLYALLAATLSTNLTKVAGNNIAPGNNAVPILNSAAAGYVAAYGSNAAALTANTDYAFKWGAGGTTQVNRVKIFNGTTINILYEESDTATNAGSPYLIPGQTLYFDIQTAAVHLQGNGTPNVGGSSSGNVVVRGWL